MTKDKLYNDLGNLRIKINDALENHDLIGFGESTDYKKGYIDASQAILYLIQEILISNVKWYSSFIKINKENI